MIYKIKALLLVLFITSGCTSIKSPENHVESFDIPINLLSQTEVLLRFNVPKGFTVPLNKVNGLLRHEETEIFIKPLIANQGPSFKEISTGLKISIPNQLYSVFILNTSRLDISLEKIIDLYLNDHIKFAPKSRIFNRSFKDHGNFKSASTFLQIYDIDGSVRIIYIETYSGSLNVVGVIYSEKINTWLDGENLMKKANEINGKVRKNVLIIQSKVL